MVESHFVATCRHFAVDETHSFVQYQLTLNPAQHKLVSADHTTLSNKGRALIQCLDRSGSMAGKPYNSVKIGAQKIGKACLAVESKPFDKFVTVLYDTRIEVWQGEDADKYSQFIRATEARGTTDFKQVFDWIATFIQDNSQSLEDVVVIFFTDGQDTENRPEKVQESLKSLIALCQQFRSSFKVRFLSIGFSADHDAKFMNQIAQAGTELGNFFYIDTSVGNYADTIDECLSGSLDIAMENAGVVKLQLTNALTTCEQALETTYVFSEDDTKDEPEITGVCLSCQLILETTSLANQSATLLSNKVKYPLALAFTQVEDPDEGVKLRASLKLANSKIFRLIQEIQLDPSQKNRVFDELDGLDKSVDFYSEQVLKIKARDTKRELMDAISECKAKVIQILFTLREMQNLDNATIAQLNDLAFRSLRQGKQKKIDARAQKNESTFQANEAKLKQYTNSLKIADLRQKYQSLIDQIGVCPMSQCDTVEAMQDGDCMCLCLQISRSEATVMDPTKLVIQGISPTFMTLNSFLDSSIFNLKKNQDASGGFDYKNQGSLALGVANESISGVLPLYLFKEHKVIARLKQAPLYGFMCCLDPMGFTASQATTIPFLVLLKALSDYEADRSEKKKFVLDLVMETCTNLIEFNENLRKQIITQANDFDAEPISRTGDVVPSVPLLAVQLLAFMTLSEEKRAVTQDPQQTEEFKLRVDFRKFARFATEEALRRSQPKTSSPLTKNQLLALLHPNTKDVVAQFTTQYIKHQKSQMNQEGIHSDNAYAQYEHLANELRKKDFQNLAQFSEENNHNQPDKVEGKTLAFDLETIVKAEVGSKPWHDSLSDPESLAAKLLQSGLKSVNQHHEQLLVTIQKLLGSGQSLTCEELLGSSELQRFAIIVQARLHPKNHHRTESIKSNQYVVIASDQDAHDYLAQLLSDNLTKSLMSAESTVKDEQAKLLQASGISTIINAPDVYLAAAAFSSSDFYIGKGDRQAFINEVLSSKEPSQIPDLKRKILLLTNTRFCGLKLWKDVCYDKDDRLRMRRDIVFKLWKLCCRETEALNVEELIQVAPWHEEAIKFWAKFLDTDYKTRHEEYGDYLAQKSKVQQKNKLLKQAAKAHKNMF